MTRNAALTVLLPGARIAPTKSTCTWGHRRLENSGTKGLSRCSIVVGRVRIITSLWRTGDGRTLPFFLTEWIKTQAERLSEKGKRSLPCSLTEHQNGTFRPIFASQHVQIRAQSVVRTPFRTVSERLSEKPWRSLQRSSPGRLRGVFRPISPALHQPNSPPECCLYPFSDSLSETVRKVPEVSTTQPYGLSKQLISDHFGLRIPAKATLRASIAPFSDSLGRGILRSSQARSSERFAADVSGCHHSGVS